MCIAFGKRQIDREHANNAIRTDKRTIMTDMLSNQIGPYMYGDGNIADLDFGGRRFKVVIASARNAGIIGSEDNGIAILDVDHQNVVLDQHAIASSGYFGPTDPQKAEFERIKAMDWSEFTAFIRSHPRYRQESVPDVNEASPVVPEKPQDRQVIFPEDLSDDSPYDKSLPLKNRLEIVDFLTSHTVHRIDGPYSDWALAWDVKVRDFDYSGHHEAFKNDRAHDAAWEAKLEADGESIFVQACEGGLAQYLEGDYSRWDGTTGFSFSRTGRMGGWVILNATPDQPRLAFPSQADLKEFLLDLDDAELARFYRDVHQIDVDLDNPKQEMAWQYAALRELFEDDLSAAAPTPHA